MTIGIILVILAVFELLLGLRFIFGYQKRPLDVVFLSRCKVAAAIRIVFHCGLALRDGVHRAQEIIF